MSDFGQQADAAILVEQHAPLVVDEICVPETLAFGQVLVDVHYAGICGSQLGEIDGVKGDDPYLPHLLGHEGSGRVLALGPGVSRVAVGDAVVMHWRPSAGLEAPKPKYTWRGRHLNAGCVTTFNDRAVVSENRLTPIPKGFDLRLAALFGCAITTGFGVVTNDAQLRIGQSLVVLGAGGVGLATVHAGSLSSAYPIVAVDQFEGRLACAKRLGATHTVNTATDDLDAQIHGILGAMGADAVVETTGNVELVQQGYKLTSAAGVCVLVGVSPADREVRLHALALKPGKRLVGSHGGSSRPDVEIPRYLRLFQAGKLALHEFIDREFSLADINTAIDEMRSGGSAGRCIIRMKVAGWTQGKSA